MRGNANALKSYFETDLIRAIPVFGENIMVLARISLFWRVFHGSGMVLQSHIRISSTPDYQGAQDGTDRQPGGAGHRPEGLPARRPPVQREERWDEAGDAFATLAQGRISFDI